MPDRSPDDPAALAAAGPARLPARYEEGKAGALVRREDWQDFLDPEGLRRQGGGGAEDGGGDLIQVAVLPAIVEVWSRAERAEANEAEVEVAR